MTNTPYRATPEQWKHLENGAMIGRPYNSALVVLELRDRIEKLEEAQEAAASAEPAPPAGSLVGQIDTDLRQDFLGLVLAIMQSESAESAAHAAVTVIANWFERHHSGRIANGSQFASLLRELLDREAGR